MSGHRALLLGRCMPPRRLPRWATGNREVRLAITCGIDWAETHHDVALVDGAGKLVAKRRISDDAEGYRRLLDLSVPTRVVGQSWLARFCLAKSSRRWRVR